MSGHPPMIDLLAPSLTEPTYWPLFPSGCSPFAAAIESHSQFWRARHGIAGSPESRPRLAATPAGRIAARLFPSADLPVLELAADILLWLTAFDDLCVEAPDSTPDTLAPRIASFVAVLSGASVPAPGFTRALAEILERAHALLPASQAARLVSALHQNLLAMLWESTTRGREIALDEYTAMRPLSVSGGVVAALIEPAAGVDLTDVSRDGNDLRTLDHHLARLIGWTNDVYSFRCEQGLSDCAVPSLPLVIAQVRGWDTEEALAEACRMCDEEARHLGDLIEGLAGSLDPRLTAYGTAVRFAVGSGRGLYTGLLRERYTPPPATPSRLMGMRRGILS